MRLLTGSLLLAWLLLTFAGNLGSLVGLQGWVDSRAFGDAARLAESLGLPKEQAPFVPSWSVLYWCTTSTSLAVAFWASVATVASFTLGFCARVTGVLTWIVVASFTANPALEYEGDLLLLILSFYLMVGYLLMGQRTPGTTWSNRLFGPLLAWPLGPSVHEGDGVPRPSVVAGVTLRLVQVHFALVILTSGLHKLQFGDWWAGVALWFPLHPPFRTALAEAMANKAHAATYLSLLNIATYATLAWQIGFPLFAWRPRWRPVLIGGAILGWIGSAFLWGLPLVGPAMMIGSASFVSPAGWRRALAWLPRRISREAARSSQPSGIKSPKSVGAVS
ncbi:MAG TPA: hypothetical protein VKE94_01495 [Gemmataceae bacterium]|nr:hypothetical protein [Gemmataceae bacterium]